MHSCWLDRSVGACRYSALESAHVLGVSLRVVLLEDCCVLGEKSLLLLLDDLALAKLLLRFEILLSLFSLTLCLVNGELLLPEAFDFALVLKLPHSALLCIHLLQTFILGELFHELALEFLFHAFLFFGALSLQSKLVLTSSLKLLTNADALLSLGTLLSLRGLLAFLHVKVVAELLLEGFLSCTLLLFGGKLLEDLVANGLSFLLHSLDFILTSLLLLSVAAHHLVFVLVHLLLATEQSALLILRKDHIGLRLFLLLLDDARLFIVFFNHALHDSVDLRLLFEVLFVSLLS